MNSSIQHICHDSGLLFIETKFLWRKDASSPMPEMLVDNLHYSNKGLARVIGVLKQALFPNKKHKNFSNRNSYEQLPSFVADNDDEFPNLQSHNHLDRRNGLSSAHCDSRGNSHINAPTPPSQFVSEPTDRPAPTKPPQPLTHSSSLTPTPPLPYIMPREQFSYPVALIQQWQDYYRRWSSMPPPPPPPFLPHHPTTLSFPGPVGQ